MFSVHVTLYRILDPEDDICFHISLILLQYKEEAISTVSVEQILTSDSLSNVKIDIVHLNGSVPHGLIDLHPAPGSSSVLVKALFF